VDDGDGGGAAVACGGLGEPPCGEAAPAAAWAHGDDRWLAVRGHELRVERRVASLPGGGGDLCGVLCEQAGIRCLI
jgi:hypothetical protein